MRPALLGYLACPRCGGTLAVAAPAKAPGEEVIEGALGCGDCGAIYPVTRGVPRMLPAALSGPEQATARAFGVQWKVLSGLPEVFREEFESYLAPLSVSDLEGLVVLDAGCGMGKFSLAALEAGAAEVVSVDLSEAVDVAQAHLGSRTKAHVVQASIYELPFPPARFDFIFSIGVLHHLPDPEKGFQALVPLVRPGGRIFVWLYALEGNEAFVRWVDPWRARLFSRLPGWANRMAATCLAAPLWMLIQAVYAPLDRRGHGGRLPYAPYFRYFSRLGFRTFWGTVHDKLVPPVAHYLTRDDLRRWLRTTGLRELSLTHRNGNSWSVLARKEPAA
jgi:SAM-dependent methyltransferase